MEHGLLRKEDRRREPGWLRRAKRCRDERSERRRKVLRLGDGDEAVSSDDDAPSACPERHGARDGQAVKDDVKDLRAAYSSSRGLGAHQLPLLKLLMCRGLYPQLAVSDEFNSSRKDSEQIFHTKHLQGVVLHPTSVYSNKPSLLHPEEEKCKGQDQGSEGNRCPQHQLLAYVSLLKTNKPYLLNCICVPALQTLLLLGRSLDTNADCSRVVVDGWLELVLSRPTEGTGLMTAIRRLREAWEQALTDCLERQGETDGEGGAGELAPGRANSRLRRELLDFLEAEMPYTLRRLTALEKQNLYVGPQVVMEMPALSGLSAGLAECRADPTKGGLKVTDYFTYNCLTDSQDLYSNCLRTFWSCPICDLYMPFTPLERMEHEMTCGAQERRESGLPPDFVEPAPPVPSALQVSYRCSVCEQDFLFTPTQVLRHKRQHASDAHVQKEGT
ncbi:probable ATP-dependent RNA helicase DHX34 [Rhincodon typus]|uniref:probable ATP-dependent RNA helicase DHX34 n=1 Tax=Rhincodon typus TaxID=259920 RepID=UPI00202F3490|nr:probable ATP-dependent RNA helicase DHX34 [Rhincodon typus]